MPGGHRGQRLDPVAAAREHEQPVAVQEQLVAQPRLERERVEQPRLRTGDVDRAQLPVRDGEERVPVRLDEVRLVDSFLLHVRAGEVDALDRSRARRRGRRAAPPRSGSGRRSRRSRTGRRTASPAPSRSRAAGRTCRTRSASASTPAAPSGRTCPPARRPRRPPARSARGVERASSPWLYASEATIVTPEGVAFCGAGNTCSHEGGSNRNGHERSTNELALDHPDRRARACTSRLFRARPLLIGRTLAGD